MAKAPEQIPGDHVDALIERLATVLKAEKLKSVLEAVPRAFVAIRMGANPGDPLLPYSERRLRQITSALSEEKRDELAKLCDGYTKFDQLRQVSSIWTGETNKHLKTIGNCMELLNRVAENSERGPLAILYDVPMSTITNMFTLAVVSIGRRRPDLYSLNENSRLGGKTQIESVEANPMVALSIVAKSRPEWAPLGSFVFDRQLRVFRRDRESWGFPASHAEVHIYETLKGELAMANRPEEVAIPGSLSQSPDEIVPTRSGRLPPVARVNRHIHGVK